MTAKMKKADPGTVRAKLSEKSSENAKRKLVYKEDKKRLLDVEKDNYSKLILIQCPDGWWKMFGHSAIIYKYKVSLSLHVTAKLLADTDYDPTSKEGYVAIKDIKDFEKRLKRVKIYAANRAERGWVFDLGYGISEAEYVAMLHEEESRIEQINKLVMPQEMLVDLSVRVKDVCELTITFARKSDGVIREIFANDMARIPVNLEKNMIRTARGTYDVDLCLSEVLNACEELNGYLKVIIDMRFLETKRIFELAYAIERLKRTAVREVNKRAIEKRKNEMVEIVKEQASGDGKSE